MELGESSSRTSAVHAGGLALAVEAARRFHLDGASKVQIAKDLGVSRFKVARLLETARAAGLVQIRVGMPPEIDEALSSRLSSALRLRRAIVMAGTSDEVADSGEAGPTGAAVGRIAAGYLQQLTTGEDVVGLAWGHAMSHFGASWSEHVPATFVQLAGAIARPDIRESAPELVRSTAAAAGGTATTFYAPLVMPDASSAEALRQQIGVREAMTLLDDLTKAVVSIGAWTPGQSTVHDSLEPSEQEQLRAAGAVAETTGLLVAQDGSVLRGLADRVVGVSEAQLRRTPEVFAIAVGATRAPAVSAVLRSGLVTSLVTHASLARELLSSD